MTLKEKVHSHYVAYLASRVQELRSMIAALSLDAQNDAKGSAGDKHETALAMMHLEQEKLNQKLREVLDQQTVLENIDSTSKHTKVALGSLITTDNFVFYVSTALPKINIDAYEVIALSPHSPLGKEMLSKKEKDTFGLNSNSFTILAIE